MSGSEFSLPDFYSTTSLNVLNVLEGDKSCGKKMSNAHTENVL